ncbi:hypothetical protein HER39_14240 [Arthrobacter deserti]|uniref:Uncharacterized protein n=1 Tax=Arthrobacter deserti TaxID=1742687 RepID=A0ABX1JQU1_9MICC|nr:hypothetical protein [Arthrobacter deserti]
MARLLRDPEVPEFLGPGWGRLLRAMTARVPGDRPSAHDVAVELRSWTEPAALAGGAADTAARVLAAGPDTSSPGVITGNVIIPSPPNRAPSVG